MDKYLILAAGGRGTRMETSLPKQFLPLGGKPVMLHALECFTRFSQGIRCIVVLPESLHDHWQKVGGVFPAHSRHLLVSGGPTRFHSVKNGLRHVPDGALVAIHDGVRPMVSLETIASVFRQAEKFGNAVPVIDVKESLRVLDRGANRAFPRENLKLVQTPQCFHSTLIKSAYQNSNGEGHTDDAGVLEAAGHRVYLTDGDPGNIKITTPHDLIMAEALLGRQNTEERT